MSMNQLEIDREVKQLIDKTNADPRFQGLLLRRVIHGFPDIRSLDFTAQNVECISELIGNAPERLVDDNDEYAVMEIPREAYYQILDMLQAYGMALKEQGKMD